MGQRTSPILILAAWSSFLAWTVPFGAVTFIATELLGRPTDTSVTVSAVADTDLEAYVEFGTAPASYTSQTQATTYAAGAPILVEIGGLERDTRYYYRLRHRQPGGSGFEARPEHTFHTQRAPGETFVFTVQADPHLGDPNTSEDLYRAELQNALGDGPDFHVDLGDTFMTEKYGGTCDDSATDDLAHRAFFGIVGASAPVYLVTGNHEGELGWLKDGTDTSLAVCATLARQHFYPCPVPGGFYSGSTAPEPFTGVRDGYYAWEWGDALLIVLDPFWYTTRKPTASGDGWDWTLGRDQYDWLKRTLETNAARYKFVFVHHLVGGLGLEGRGGIEGAGLYEWGGENADASQGFAGHRPGWSEPIHQLLAENGVSIAFHGHDHVFVKQEMDGVVYQECPRPNLRRYDDVSMASEAGYVNGTILPNPGHLRVTVSPAEVKVDYVRAFLPGDGTNGEVAHSYSVASPISTCAITSVVKASNPFRLKVLGTGFLPGCTVQFNGTPAPTTTYADGSKIVAKSGAALKAMVPAGVPVQVVVHNPDGGQSAPFKYVR